MIFCISPQRSGTKSFGLLAQQLGMNVVSWQETRDSGIARAFACRDFVTIHKFLDSRPNHVFEDYPFFDFEFIKFAFFNYESKFIYLGRPASSWFESMLTHSDGVTPGSEIAHADTYGRWANLAGYLRYLDIPIDINSRGITHLVSSREHYLNWHNAHRLNVQAFFSVVSKLDSQNGEARLFEAEWRDLNIISLTKFLGCETSNAQIPLHHQTRGRLEKLVHVYSRRLT